jgi:NADPH:quinone reductase-like Zn-dependent oxidoreductase
LGHDLAGVVVKVGSEVTFFKVGDEVYALPPSDKIGTFAEYIAIDESYIARKPKNLTMEEAASIPLVGLAVWQVLVEKVDLERGQKVFIQAGSGGVGTFAIQLAKHLGAYVATTTSTDNFELVKTLGADLVIDYKKDDFETILKDYDVVLNSQSAETLQKSMRILKRGGKAISISGPADVDFARQIKANWLIKIVMYFLSRKIKMIAKKLGVHYSFLFTRAQGEQLAQITSLIETGVIKPVIDKVFPFSETNEAMEYVEAGRSKGKVVIKVR